MSVTGLQISNDYPIDTRRCQYYFDDPSRTIAYWVMQQQTQRRRILRWTVKKVLAKQRTPILVFRKRVLVVSQDLLLRRCGRTKGSRRSLKRLMTVRKAQQMRLDIRFRAKILQEPSREGPQPQTGI